MVTQYFESEGQGENRVDHLSFDCGVSIRKFPYPYKALLALSTDLDGTRTSQEYFELLRFWNSGEPTELGDGLSLQLSNSIYFGMPPGAFCYWNASEKERAIIRECIEAGLVDTLHSYGDSVTDARRIDECIAEIDRYGMTFPIWSNHSQAPSNFASIRHPNVFGGDDPASDVYHADKTIGNGIRYAALGQVTGVLGQGTWPNPLRSTALSVSSIRNTVMQSLKIASAPFHPRYRAHVKNQPFMRVSLQDGQETLEVLRSNWHPLGIRRGCSGGRIHELVQSQFLEKLSCSRGTAIIYTHLADIFRIGMLERINQTMALRNLKRCLENNKILLLTTADLLDYLAVTENIGVKTSRLGDGVRVDISLERFPCDEKRSEAFLLRSGLTLVVSSMKPPIITVHSRVPDVRLEIERVGESSWRVCFPKRNRKLPASLSGNSFSGSKQLNELLPDRTASATNLEPL